MCWAVFDVRTGFVSNPSAGWLHIFGRHHPDLAVLALPYDSMRILRLAEQLSAGGPDQPAPVPVRLI